MTFCVSSMWTFGLHPSLHVKHLFWSSKTRTGNACDFEAPQYAKTFQASSFRSQIYFGGTGCKSSYFRRVHGTPGANKCSFANPVFQGWDHSAPALVVLQSKLLRTKTHDGFICSFGNTSVISPNMCQLHWSLLLSRPQTTIALSRGKAVYMGVSKNRGTQKWMVYSGKPY